MTSEERGKGIGGGGGVGGRGGVEWGGPKNVIFLVTLFFNDSLIPVNSGKISQFNSLQGKTKNLLEMTFFGSETTTLRGPQKILLYRFNCPNNYLQWNSRIV